MHKMVMKPIYMANSRRVVLTYSSRSSSVSSVNRVFHKPKTRNTIWLKHVLSHVIDACLIFIQMRWETIFCRRKNKWFINSTIKSRACETIFLFWENYRDSSSPLPPLSCQIRKQRPSKPHNPNRYLGNEVTSNTNGLF